MNTACVAPAAEALSVNFQDEATVPPPGYLSDFGEPFGLRSGLHQGQGRSYGWVVPSSGAPVSLVGNGRNRASTGELRRTTLMHMQGDDVLASKGSFTGVAIEGAWELALPNAAYDVTVAVGDPLHTDSVHGLRVEGVDAIVSFVPTLAAPYQTATVRVNVADGRLTLTPTGNNTKLAFVDVVPVAPPMTCTIQVNFQDPATVVPDGWVRDSGEAFGSRTAADQGQGLVYGWIDATTRTPVDLASGGTTPGNGRNRGTPTEVRLATLMHMQGGSLAAHLGGFNGTAVDGIWELALPNGTYLVTVSVGDAAHIDSAHRLVVEGRVAIDRFIPTANERFREATVTVGVADGRLTLESAGGDNTKVNFVRVEAAASARPQVTAATPGPGATDAFRDTSIVLDVALPTPGKGVDGTTLTPANLKLVRTADGAEVPYHANTSGGGDIIVVVPVGPLDASTSYRLTLTEGVKDVAGAGFLPFQTSFVTGTATSYTGGQVAFEKVALETASRADFTSVVVGPDGRLYAGTLTGELWRFPIEPDGRTGPPEVLTSLVAAERGPRAVIGLAFAPEATDTNLVLWVTHGAPQLEAAPDWSGKVTRLAGPSLSEVTDFVVGLPRSIRDHMTNSLAFGPDGALYVLQGSNSAMGAPDSNWGFRPERLLTAALLRFHPAAVVAPPLDVRTEDSGSYDPFAANAPLTIYASGIRNAYDLVFHSNGNLYVPTNGSAAPGNTPGTPSPLPAACATRVDATVHGPWTTPPAPALTPVRSALPDYLYRVVAGGYYGHPNPARCEWVMNGGNPSTTSDPGEVEQYPVATTPDRNWRGIAYDFGLHASANGAIEYGSNIFGPRLRGKLLVVRYSVGKDLVVLTPGATGDIVAAETGIAGLTGFDNPLDVTEDPRTGSLYVSELGGRAITLLRPVVGRRISVSATELWLGNVVRQQIGATLPITIRNTGASPLTLSSASLQGASASQFEIAGVAFPATLPPGESVSLGVRFAPTIAGPAQAELVLGSDDPTNPSVHVTLRALGTVGLGGNLEPSLQWILNALDRPIVVGDPDPSDNALPADGLLGNEIAAQRFEKASSGPVIVEPIAGFGPQDRTPAVRFGWYSSGNAAAKAPLFTLAPSEAQRVLPVADGTLTFDPGAASFGFYSIWPTFSDREIFSEDALNPPSGSIRHHVRVYPLAERTGQIVPDAYVVAHEESIAGTFDYQDIVVIVRNVRPASADQPQLVLANRDEVPFADRLVMNRIGSLDSPPPNRVHDRVVLELRNGGLADLMVQSLTPSGPFALVDAPALPLVLPPGATRAVTVRFVATSNGANDGRHAGTLTIACNDPARPNRVVELAGFWQSVSEGNQEPDLLEVVNVFGWKTVISGAGQRLDGKGRVEAIGDEVIAPYWQLADAGRPATIHQIAAFHTQGNTATVRWFARGSSSTTTLFTHAGIDGQSFMPLRNGSNEAARATFQPAMAFGFQIDGEWSDPAKNSHTADLNNGCTEPCGHHVRFWPLKDRNGAVLPDQYLMVMDYSGINYDYNDNVYVVAGVRPAAD